MPEGRFANMTVMITGAAGGFGAAAARRFASEGAALLLSDLDSAALHVVRDELRTIGCDVAADAFDITDESRLIAHIEHGRAQLGELDVAINNAGIGQALKPLSETDSAEFDRIMSVNAKSVFLGMKHQLPAMVARERGAILNIASAAGVVGAGHMAAYAASKHAVVGLTRAAADEVARHNVRVNALCPAFAPTPLLNDIAEDMGARAGISRKEADVRITARIPMRRMATIDEVVQAMLWACDPGNTFMTGQAISVDGGLSAI